MYYTDPRLSATHDAELSVVRYYTRRALVYVHRVCADAELDCGPNCMAPTHQRDLRSSDEVKVQIPRTYYSRGNQCPSHPNLPEVHQHQEQFAVIHERPSG
jgi:hypothetical protein